MRACLTILIVLAVAASMAVASLYVSSAYYAPDHAVPSRANARVMTLDNVDLEQAADLYRPVPADEGGRMSMLQLP
jgi:hypothetical protein